MLLEQILSIRFYGGIMACLNGISHCGSNGRCIGGAALFILVHGEDEIRYTPTYSENQ